MASLKDIRQRITSVKSTRKITSAMKIVSAAKFHKAQEMAVRFAAYQAKFSYALSLALRHSPGVTHPLMHSVNPKAPVDVLLLSSNSSLCGAYNQNVSAQAQTLVAHLVEEGCDLQFHAFGRRIADALKRSDLTPRNVNESLVANPSYADVVRIYNALEQDFLQGRSSRIYVVFNRFRNAAVQESTHVQLLPLDLDVISQNISSEPQSRLNLEYIIEPSAEEFFNFALPHIGRLTLYSFFLNNFVGEHGARMTAMTQATDNADSLISDLTLQYNKARQSAITNEILEIVSGANALRNE